MFSTLDQDHDTHSGGNCAAARGTGWWYGWCSLSYIGLDSTDGVWLEDVPVVEDVTASRMLLKII